MGHDIVGFNKAGEEIAYARFRRGIIMQSYCTVYLMQINSMQGLVGQAQVPPSPYNKLKGH